MEEIDYRLNLLETIGAPAMMELLAEECSELSQAALKLSRILRKENPTPVTEADAENHLCEEMADVQLCINEIIYFAKYVIPFQEWYSLKSKRLQKRMHDFKERKCIQE